ncbi:hypothetical protein BBH88_03860 [Planococcus antarcticus DSM 14505]|nr:hypothetical protein BBH88_03860 [Planococcus antarcticus DSM 14505]
MKHTIRQEEMISRIGGDEFIVVLTSPAEEMAKRGRLVGERIISTINKPYSLNGQHASISCSIGGAFWVASNSKKIEETIKLADEALYTAKKKGKNQVHFAKD